MNLYSWSVLAQQVFLGVIGFLAGRYIILLLLGHSK